MILASINALYVGYFDVLRREYPAVLIYCTWLADGEGREALENFEVMVLGRFSCQRRSGFISYFYFENWMVLSAAIDWVVLLAGFAAI